MSKPLDLAALRAVVAAMTPDLTYYDDIGWLSGVDHANMGEIYTVASLSLDSTAHGRCYNARANGTGLAALRNAAPGLLRWAALGQAYAAHRRAADGLVLSADMTDEIEDRFDAARTAYDALDAALRACMEHDR